MIETVDVGVLLCRECASGMTCECFNHLNMHKEMKKVLSALSTSGFLQIVNHGVDESIICNAVHVSESFFSNTLEYKMSHESKDKARRGYSPLLSENFASLVGESSKPNDTVEKYRIGPIVSDEDKIRNCEYYNSKEARVHFFLNDWKDLSDESISKVVAYYEAMSKLAGELLSVIEKAVRLSSGFFDDLIDRHTSIMSLNHYPPLNTVGHSDSMVVRVAEHTDVSVLTIVYQSIAKEDTDMGGLEVYDATCGRWLQVPYTPTAFVVNVGDCLSDWSRGLFKSSMHRVLMKESLGRQCNRYSLAYFFTPNYDAELSWPNADGAVEDGEKPINYTTWRKNRIKTAIQMLKKTK